VLDLLRDYSVENGINGRQLNLIIKSTDPKIIGTNNPMRVTVKFEDITLHEALRHLADVANLDLRFDDKQRYFPTGRNNEKASNKRVQGTRHKVSGPLTRDVRHKK
jgi:hypothetical protein